MKLFLAILILLAVAGVEKQEKINLSDVQEQDSRENETLHCLGSIPE